MYFRFLYNRLFHRTSWKNALRHRGELPGYRELCTRTAQIVYDHYAAIVKYTGKIREGSSFEVCAGYLSEMDSRMVQLQALIPYANNAQRASIADAERTIEYAKSIAPAVRIPRKETEIIYYSVFIPTMNGNFYYLALQDFQPGDIVAIPFGADDMQIYGIVKEVFCKDYWKMPLPLWKMKYIISLAPTEIVDTYHRLLNQRNF